MGLTGCGRCHRQTGTASGSSASSPCSAAARPHLQHRQLAATGPDQEPSVFQLSEAASLPHTHLHLCTTLPYPTLICICAHLKKWRARDLCMLKLLDACMPITQKTKRAALMCCGWPMAGMRHPWTIAQGVCHTNVPDLRCESDKRNSSMTRCPGGGVGPAQTSHRSASSRPPSPSPPNTNICVHGTSMISCAPLYPLLVAVKQPN